MSNENVLRTLYDAQARGELDTYLSLLSDDFVLHVPGQSRIAGDYVGKEEMRRHLREIKELSGGTFRSEVHHVVGGNDHAVGLIEARGEKDGTTVELPRIHVWHVNDGVLTELWIHPLDQATFDAYWE